MSEQKKSALQMCVSKTAKDVEKSVDMLELSNEIEAISNYSLVDGTSYRVTVKIEKVEETS